MPVITSLHDRMPNTLCVSAIVRRANFAGQERAGVDIAVPLHDARHQHARKRFRRRQLQVGVVLIVAQQDVVARRALLDQVVLERQRLDHRVGDDRLRGASLRRAARRDAGSCRRRPDTSGRGRAGIAPCRRRGFRRRRSRTDRRRADAATAPSARVYLFANDAGETLYVGKARSLRTASAAISAPTARARVTTRFSTKRSGST